MNTLQNKIISLSRFLYQALKYKLSIKKKKKFNEVAKAKFDSETPTIDPLVLDAFQKNILTSAHHGLLYEKAYNHKKIGSFVIAHYPGEFTDIYRGNFVCDDNSNYLVELKEAINDLLKESKKSGRFCCFLDMDKSVVEVIENFKIPLKKFYLGNEWRTNVGEFNLHGSKSRDFRNAIHRILRDGWQLSELQEGENLDEINALVTKFYKVKHLSFPRLDATLVKRYVYHPSIHRRIWKVTKADNQLIAAAVLCKIGVNQYFVEHAVHDWQNRTNYLFNWCFSQILLQLQQENVHQVSWGDIAHLYNEEISSDDVDLWIIKKYYQYSSVRQFTLNTIQFKKNFIPISQYPRWTLYSDFRAEVLLDIAELVGY